MINTTRHPRLKLYLIFLLTFIPLVISWIMFHYSSYFNLKTINHGTLITPPVYSNELADLDKKQWQIVYIPEKCNAECQNLMFSIHQLRIALGKDAKRIALTVIVNEKDKNIDAHDFEKKILTNKQLNSLNQLIYSKVTNGNPTLLYKKIYLVDPAGNLFMYYPENINLMYILKDIKRVLEVSQIG